jgi:putative transposase
MIDEQADLSVARQCELLNVSRSGHYMRKKAASDRRNSGGGIAPTEVRRYALARKIDEIWTEHPFMGSRQIARVLGQRGTKAHRSQVQRIMQKMGIYGMAPGPHTSTKHPENKTYPYLLRGIEITEPNQVWATDISYIPHARGHFYMVAIQDWYSRKILSWRISSTLDLSFCLEALDEALAKYKHPEIFNTDQGSHFTSNEWTQRLKENGIKISMDGKGRALDNVMVERFWRTLKYEHIYLNPKDSGTELRAGVDEYVRWYNEERPHSSLGGLTPNQVYGETGDQLPAAA